MTKQAVYNYEIEAVLTAYDSGRQGLPSNEAEKRLRSFGPNRLVSNGSPLWRRLVEPFASMFVLILIFALAISLFERKWFEAGIIGFIVVVNALIYYFQQYSVGRVLRSLQSKDVQVVPVLRDGKTVDVPSEALVPGDIVHVSEGMKVPADGRLIDANHLQVDEALLTGESLPVHKQAGSLAGVKQIYEQSNCVFKGSYIKAGTGMLLVTATGNATELGTISELADEAVSSKTTIEKKIDDITKKILLAVLAVGVAVFVLAGIRGIAPEEALRFSLTVIVSAVPEGLPVALTIVLLFSARRMARSRALVKKISAMETLGAVTLIATDKTGTLTQNKLSVAETNTPHGTQHILRKVIKLSLNGSEDHAGDPLDELLLDATHGVTLGDQWVKKKDFPFSQALRISATVWHHGPGYSLHVKGAPEHIVRHTHNYDQLAAQSFDRFSGNGYRVIAFAHKDLGTHVPTELSASVLGGLTYDGIVGFSDEVRPGIDQSVLQAQKAGIKVVMMTGDHARTAGHIAQKVGIVDDANRVTRGEVLSGASTEAIRERLAETPVFARVLPEHKYALLKATKGMEITAMTGDGVNDIPALVEADVGFAMGSGTDAAKDASDVVLLDDNFHTIIEAIRAGRTVLANVRKMLVYLLGTSGGEVLTMMGALLFNIPLPLSAVQILWINLVTDGVTVIPLGLSPAEKRHMQQPPSSPQAPLLSSRLLTRTFLIAASLSVSVLILFQMNLSKGYAYAQTMAFIGIIVVQWANALSVNFEYASWLQTFRRPNKRLLVAIAGSLAMNLALFLTPAGKWFGIVDIAQADVLIAIAVPTVVSLVVVDLHKLAVKLLAPASR